MKDAYLCWFFEILKEFQILPDLILLTTFQPIIYLLIVSKSEFSNIAVLLGLSTIIYKLVSTAKSLTHDCMSRTTSLT